ncbi:MAG TPA: hypothetical protein VN673_18385 [Clostridia bacterium]|nr:hypothetical protein [Clostridia bacterium]
MRTYISKLVVAGVLVSGCGLGLAKPIQRADVAAESTWVLHVDVDALRPTAMGQHILSELNKPETQARLAAFSAVFAFDPRTALHGLTLYSAGPAPADGVLLVYADIDAGRLETLVKAAKGHESTEYKGHVIHNWIDDKKKAKNGIQPRTYAAIHGGRVVLFGQREARVAQALNVLDQTAPALSAGSNYPELGATGDTSFIQAAARKLDFPESDPNAALMRLSQSVRLLVGESQGRVNTVVTLVAKDEEVAGHMTSIAQGVVALMKLQKEKPEAVKVAEATTLKQEGATLVGTVSLPVNEVVEVLKADAARKAR